jgi:hypothetical protein
MVKGLHDIGWMVDNPKASMYIWAKIPEYYAKMGSIEFTKRLLEEAKIAVSPGIGFGEYGDDHVRIALIENEHRLRQALRGIRRCSGRRVAERRGVISPRPATLEANGIRLEPLSKGAPRRAGQGRRGRQALGAVLHFGTRRRRDREAT